VQFLLTTVPGLEDFAIEELAERFPVRWARARHMTGRVVADVDAEPPALFSLKTVERFGIFLGDGRAKTLQEVVSLAVERLPAALRYLTKNTTAGVRTERWGATTSLPRRGEGGGEVGSRSGGSSSASWIQTWR